MKKDAKEIKKASDTTKKTITHSVSHMGWLGWIDFGGEKSIAQINKKLLEEIILQKQKLGIRIGTGQGMYLFEPAGIDKEKIKKDLEPLFMFFEILAVNEEHPYYNNATKKELRRCFNDYLNVILLMGGDYYDLKS